MVHHSNPCCGRRAWVNLPISSLSLSHCPLPQLSRGANADAVDSHALELEQTSWGGHGASVKACRHVCRQNPWSSPPSTRNCPETACGRTAQAKAQITLPPGLPHIALLGLVPARTAWAPWGTLNCSDCVEQPWVLTSTGEPSTLDAPFVQSIRRPFIHVFVEIFTTRVRHTVAYVLTHHGRLPAGLGTDS